MTVIRLVRLIIVDSAGYDLCLEGELGVILIVDSVAYGIYGFKYWDVCEE